MAVLFLLLALLLAVVVAAVGFENTTASFVTLLDRSLGQLTEGQLLVLFAGLGFLIALFLSLAFGAFQDSALAAQGAEVPAPRRRGRVDELERENSRLRQELESVQRGRADAVAERDRAEAATDRLRSDTASRDRADGTTDRSRVAAMAHDRPGGTAADDARTDRPAAHDPAVAPPPEPTSARRERLDDRTTTSPVRGHARAADADEHARAADADEEARRR